MVKAMERETAKVMAGFQGSERMKGQAAGAGGTKKRRVSERG